MLIKQTLIADDGENMITIPPPTSNAERQRQFRQRNPGYYQRLQARKRAGIRATIDVMVAVDEMSTPKETLALPAPVEVLELPGLNMVTGESDAYLREMVVMPLGEDL